MRADREDILKCGCINGGLHKIFVIQYETIGNSEL